MSEANDDHLFMMPLLNMKVPSRICDWGPGSYRVVPRKMNHEVLAQYSMCCQLWACPLIHSCSRLNCLTTSTLKRHCFPKHSASWFGLHHLAQYDTAHHDRFDSAQKDTMMAARAIECLDHDVCGLQVGLPKFLKLQVPGQVASRPIIPHHCLSELPPKGKE
jgi:hypothetical protein